MTINEVVKKLIPINDVMSVAHSKGIPASGFSEMLKEAQAKMDTIFDRIYEHPEEAGNIIDSLETKEITAMLKDMAGRLKTMKRES